MWTFDREIERNQDLSGRWIVRIQLRDETGKTEGRHMQFAASPTDEQVATFGAGIAEQMNTVQTFEAPLSETDVLRQENEELKTQLNRLTEAKVDLENEKQVLETRMEALTAATKVGEVIEEVKL